MITLRKVQIYAMVYDQRIRRAVRTPTETGLFHAFSTEGISSEEIVPVAIVELDDGTVKIVPARLIQFLDPPNKPAPKSKSPSPRSTVLFK